MLQQRKKERNLVIQVTDLEDLDISDHIGAGMMDDVLQICSQMRSAI